MANEYSDKWFSEKRQMLEAVAVSLRVQAAGTNHAALKPLADVIRRLTIAASSPEALSSTMESLGPHSVSICAFVLVKQVN